VLLAGVAAIVATPAYVGNLLDDPARDGLVVAVLLFLTGALYGAATYWIGGGALALGVRSAGGASTYRHARHIFAYAAVPAVLSLGVWLVALAAYGEDLFRTGGADERGAGHWLLPLGQGVFFAWSFVLLVLGVRTVHDWAVTRSLGAIALAVLALLGLGLAFSVL
jgi:Yip1 domain